MSKYEFHICVKDTKPAVVRHYRWLTKMYPFVLRNPGMFKGKMLTVYNMNRPVAHISWDEINEQMNQDTGENRREGVIRSLLFNKHHLLNT